MTNSGTYVAIRPTSATLALLSVWAAENQIVLDPDLHVTLVYSRKAINVQPTTDEYQAQFAGFTKLGDKTVALLSCPALDRRHQQFLNMGGTHDFTFKAHISLCDSCDWSSWTEIAFGLLFGGEYTEELRP